MPDALPFLTTQKLFVALCLRFPEVDDVADKAPAMEPSSVTIVSGWSSQVEYRRRGWPDGLVAVGLRNGARAG